jgi:hypothetical protein
MIQHLAKRPLVARIALVALLKLQGAGNAAQVLKDRLALPLSWVIRLPPIG